MLLLPIQIINKRTERRDINMDHTHKKGTVRRFSEHCYANTFATWMK